MSEPSLLLQMVERELRRREEGDGKHPMFAYIINDAANAMTDVDAAASAIIADAARREREEGDSYMRVTVSPAIADEVVEALHKAHPRRLIMTKRIVGSTMFSAARPLTPIFEEQLDAAAARAAERIRKLRESSLRETR